MATQAVTIVQDMTSDATYRVWVNGFHNALAALGTLVQTSDTGQINLTTATKATGGYEIWRFNDSLQGTAPCYIKFFFGSFPQIQVTYGTGTDGAGTLTGRTFFLDANNLTNTTLARQYYFSSTTSRLTIWMDATSGNDVLMSIERSRDNTGAETGVGLVGLMMGPNHSFLSWITCGTVSLPATTSIAYVHGCIWLDAPSLIGSQMTAFTFNPLGLNYQVMNPPLGLLAYYSTDVGFGLTLPSITLYGVAHNYINPSNTPNNQGISTAARFMMLYE